MEFLDLKNEPMSFYKLFQFVDKGRAIVNGLGEEPHITTVIDIIAMVQDNIPFKQITAYQDREGVLTIKSSRAIEVLHWLYNHWYTLERFSKETVDSGKAKIEQVQLDLLVIKPSKHNHKSIHLIGKY